MDDSHIIANEYARADDLARAVMAIRPDLPQNRALDDWLVSHMADLAVDEYAAAKAVLDLHPDHRKTQSDAGDPPALTRLARAMMDMRPDLPRAITLEEWIAANASYLTEDEWVAASAVLELQPDRREETCAMGETPEDLVRHAEAVALVAGETAGIAVDADHKLWAAQASGLIEWVPSPDAHWRLTDRCRFLRGEIPHQCGEQAPC